MENLKNNIFSEFKGKIAYFCKDNPLLSNPDNISDYNLSGMVFGKNDGLEDFLPNLNDGFIQGNFDPTHLLKHENEISKCRLLDVFYLRSLPKITKNIRLKL